MILDTTSKYGRKFRLRFRMPLLHFRNLVNEARDDNWFPNREKPTALLKEGICLDILMLGSLRVLGRGWTFDDLEEATGVCEEVHRSFFHEFVGKMYTPIPSVVLCLSDVCHPSNTQLQAKHICFPSG